MVVDSLYDVARSSSRGLSSDLHTDRTTLEASKELVEKSSSIDGCRCLVTNSGHFCGAGSLVILILSPRVKFGAALISLGARREEI